MADVDLDALERCMGVCGDESASIETVARAETLLYDQVPALIAELRRRRGQTAYPWTCRTCLTTQPVEAGVVCHYVCESCRAEFERLRGQTEVVDLLESIGTEVLCEACAKVHCPHADRLHYHHDGCPSCYAHAPKEGV